MMIFGNSIKSGIRSFCMNLYHAAVRAITLDGVEHAGYMAFMVLLSFFPVMVFLLAFTSFLGASDVGTAIIETVLNNLPRKLLSPVHAQIGEIVKTPPPSLMNLAVCGSVWTASSFVEGLRTILNRMHGVSCPPPYWHRRILSMAQFCCMMLIIILLALIFLVCPIILDRVPELRHVVEVVLSHHFFVDNISNIWSEIKYIFLFGVLLFIVATAYYIIPSAHIRFRDTIPGAILTVLLWTICGSGLSFYITYFAELNVIYGSLGGIIIALIFFYLSNMSFIFGAAFNYVQSSQNGTSASACKIK